MPRGPLVAVAALVLAACGGLAPHPAPPPEQDDLLFLRTPTGITVVNALSGAPAVRHPDAVPATDWSAVVQTVRGDGSTQVVARDPSSGAELWSGEVPRGLEVKVASTDGRYVALGEPSRNTGYPAGRSSTTLVVAGADLAEPTTIELEGNYVPEAFSTDGQSLFVIEYLPPEDPSSYRVRRLDLRTEEVMGVYTVDAELQRAMEGTARIQASSPDGRRLYTLYTVDGPGDTRHAFIHVLALDELWAHCIDLPDGFGTAEEAMALAVAPDGRRLYVVDRWAGSVAEVDTPGLTVTRTAPLYLGPRATTHAVQAPGGMLYVASGEEVVPMDTATLTRQGTWDVGRRITGLQAGADGTRLYVGLDDEIAVIDTATGNRVSTLSPENIGGGIDRLGQSIVTVDDEQKQLVCAC